MLWRLRLRGHLLCLHHVPGCPYAARFILLPSTHARRRFSPPPKKAPWRVFFFLSARALPTQRPHHCPPNLPAVFLEEALPQALREAAQQSRELRRTLPRGFFEYMGLMHARDGEEGEGQGGREGGRLSWEVERDAVGIGAKQCSHLGAPTPNTDTSMHTHNHHHHYHYQQATRRMRRMRRRRMGGVPRSRATAPTLWRL